MDVLAGAVRDALNNVRSDHRVPAHNADRVRAAVRDLNERRAEWSAQNIVDALPSFETLSADAQRALYAAVLRDDSWSMWLRKASWRQALVRGIRTLALKVPGHYRRLRRFLDMAELSLLLWHARLVHELYRRALSRRGWRSREPTLAALLKIAGLDARAIASLYLQRTPQLSDTAAYWHDPTHLNTVGVVIGIDFIVNDEGVWFVESNLNAGLIEERSELYDDDPFVVNMLDFVKNKGFSSLVFLACNDYPVDTIMAGRIAQAAQTRGLRATVLEDRHSPRGRLSQSFLVPPFDAKQTLVVRSRMFHTTLDAFFHNKTLTLHALQSYQRTYSDRDVRLPLTGAESFPHALVMAGPFPNLVYKFPERDQGQGVIFLKVPSLARAQAIITDTVEMNRHSVANVWTKMRYRLNLEDQTGVFQEYVPSFLLHGRRLSVARAHVLATPIGMTFLSAHRIVSNIPVPESLDEGLVRDAKPFIVNYSLDSVHAAMPADEERRVSTAALSVVKALCWAVESRFQTTATR